MNWELIWVALAALVPVIALIGALAAFIRNQDLKLISNRHDTCSLDCKGQMMKLQDDVKLKLYVDEFRRYEDRSNKQFQQLIDGTNELNNKMDTKFEKIFEMLTRRRDDRHE